MFHLFLLTDSLAMKSKSKCGHLVLVLGKILADDCLKIPFWPTNEWAEAINSVYFP